MERLNFPFSPILILAFSRVASAVIISLTIPLHFYQAGYPPSLIGLISSAITFSYIFSTLIFKNLLDKLGKKKSLIISAVGMALVNVVYQFTLEPVTFAALRMVEGVFLGLYWPALGSSLSAISSLSHIKNDNNLKDKLMKHYSLSWNFGAIFGFLEGSITLLLISDLHLMFNLALIFLGIDAITAFFVKEPKEEIENIDLTSLVNAPISKNQTREDLIFPLYIPIVLTITYGFLGEGFKFAYPLRSEELSYPLFTNYLLTFILSTSQMIFTTRFMSLSIQKLKKLVIIAIGILSVVFLIAWINQNVVVFAVLFGFIGFCISIVYCLAFKLIIYKNIAQNTSKYSSYFETAIGISFFSGPLVAGFISNVEINLAFLILSLLAVCALIFFLVVGHKIEKE